MDPGVANREGSKLPEDIANADIVILGTGAPWQSVAPNSELGSEEATAVLNSQFCLRKETYPYRVFTRCEREPKN
jgi:hypothetical protein